MSTEPNLRDQWLALAQLIASASSGEVAADLMRAVTGLSGTDPEADRAELARRVTEARKSAGAAAPADLPVTEIHLAGQWAGLPTDCPACPCCSREECSHGYCEDSCPCREPS